MWNLCEPDAIGGLGLWAARCGGIVGQGQKKEVSLEVSVCVSAIYRSCIWGQFSWGGSGIGLMFIHGLRVSSRVMLLSIQAESNLSVLKYCVGRPVRLKWYGCFFDVQEEG